MGLVSREHCGKCRYYGPASHTCDYYCITKERRGCPAGEGCTKFEKGTKAKNVLKLPPEREKIEPKPKRHRRRKFNELEAWKMYELERLNDREIGERLGVVWTTVLKWRKANHYPCNYKAGGQKQADRPATKPPEIQEANT